ncbi:MAG: AAA family ATPase [Solirubrobacterales bacterium]|nr:AAA family ATPase [Solirubrobacterales bacterium]
MVGRREELARLRDAVGRIGRGRTILAITGEPGIGKSRLLAELLSLAEASGSLTLSGRAAQFERDVPFAVFIDALDAYLAAQNPRRHKSLGAGHLTELARIFPSLAQLGEPDRGAIQAERYRAHYAVRALLDLLAHPRPVVLALDDLQWADEASLELVAHLLRRPGSERGLLALAYRPGEAPSRLSEAIDVAAREQRLELVGLGPLSEDEAAKLLPDRLEAEARSRLYRDSGGNPFYLEQLCRAPQAGARTGGVEPHSLGNEVPPTVAAALAGELAELGPGARALLEGASVAGDPFSIELAAAAAGLSEAESRVTLDELVTRELVRPTEVPRRFGFRHPVVRRTVYTAAKQGWRLGAHARVRDALTEQGAAATELAHHVTQAATAGDEEAVAVLERAAREAAPLSPGPAAHWLGAALRLLPEADPARRLQLLVPMSSALAASGRLEESRAAVLDTLELLPGEAEAERVALISSLAAVDLLLGRHDEAGERVRSGLAGLADPTSPGAVALQIEVAAAALYIGDWDRGLAAGEGALAGAKALDRRQLVVVAEALRSQGFVGLGRIAAAERGRTTAAELLDSFDDSELAERVDAAYYLGAVEYFLERYEDAVRHLRRGVAVARSTRQGQFLIQTMIGEAWCLVHLGRTREAIELAEDASETAGLLGNRQALTWALGVRCEIARSVGDLDVAIRAGEESVAIGADRDESVISSASRAHLALAYADAGEHERSIRQMELAGAPDFPMFHIERKPFWCEALTRAALGLGLQDEAERWVRRAEALVDGLDLPVAAAAARQARARLLLAGGEPEPAAELALEAAAGQESRGARIEAARSRILAGQALAAADRPERAVSELKRAHAELDACEVIRYRDEAARELRRLGLRMPRIAPRAGAALGVAALSEREREISELAAAAKTNREIAATLYISEKTVEKHLSKVFTKLEVGGRAGIGARLAGEDAEAERT